LTTAALYKSRGQVELFINWIKQNLRIKRSLGNSENAVKTQVRCAVAAYMLTAIINYVRIWTVEIGSSSSPSNSDLGKPASWPVSSGPRFLQIAAISLCAGLLAHAWTWADRQDRGA